MKKMMSVFIAALAIVAMIIPPAIATNSNKIEPLESPITAIAVNAVSEATEAVAAILHEHNYEAYVTEPTCTTNGYTTFTCTTCADEYDGNIVEPHGHKYGEWELTEKATAIANGIEARFCNYCGKMEIREYICTHTNTYQEVATEATCVAEGVMNNICDECSKIVSTENIPVKEHVFSEWLIDEKASPETDGTKVRACSCGEFETMNYSFKAAGNNCIYIESANINACYVVAPFTQEAVDNNDIVYNETRIDANNPIILGHNYGSLKKLYNTKVGSYIYLFKNGEMSKYKVVISERAIITKDNHEFEGLETGHELFADEIGPSIRFYTCYKDKEYGNIRWIVRAEPCN